MGLRLCPRIVQNPRRDLTAAPLLGTNESEDKKVSNYLEMTRE